MDVTKSVMDTHSTNNSFPPPRTPPPHVQKARVHRNNHLLRASGIGISIRLLIIVLELAGVWFYGSAVLLLDALGTMVDVVTSVILIGCIKLASRPPDEDHPFGHGRYEPLAGLQLGVFLMGLGAVMAFQQTKVLYWGEATRVIGGEVWLIPLFAALLLIGVSYRLLSAAKQQKSTALEAEAWHFRVDGWNSFFASGVLLAGLFLPEWSGILDASGALVIAVAMVVVGFLAARENFHQLMDRIPEEACFECVRLASRNVAGVLDIEKIRIQQYGPDAHVDIDIEVDPQLSVEAAHRISQEVRVAIQIDWPQVRDATVHIEPYYPGDH